MYAYSKLYATLQLVNDGRWLPGDVSGYKAMHNTFLGPFLSLSGLAEDSAPVRSHYYHGNSEGENVGGTIQQRLSICRVSLSLIWIRLRHLKCHLSII